MNEKANNTVASGTWERQSLAWAAVILCILLGMWGCLAIYSTQIAALRDWDFLRRQIVFLCIGIPLLILCWKLPFRFYRRFGVLFALLTLAGVIGVLLWGRPVNGMSGWFEPLPNIQIQPSEFAKPFYLLLLMLVWNKLSKRGEWAGCLGAAVCALLFAIPVALEPDYGSAVIFLAMLPVFLFVAGCSLWKLAGGLAVLAIPVAAAAAMRWETVSQRFEAVFGKADVLSAGWHVQQFQLAIARGGWTGSKLGNTVWIENYLPLAHNDSIFAAMSETLGILGSLFLLAALAALVMILIKLAAKCETAESKTFVASCAFLLALQALLHISVNATLLPPTGLTLPLISYGGSSLASTMIIVGMALSAATTEKRD